MRYEVELNGPRWCVYGRNDYGSTNGLPAPDQPAASLQERMGLPVKVACSPVWDGYRLYCPDGLAFAKFDNQGDAERIADLVNTVVGQWLDEKGYSTLCRDLLYHELNALGRRLMERGDG